MAGDSGREPEAALLARDAVTRARLGEQQGDAAAALRWLERAHRLVPRDPNIALSLAAACLASDPVRAAGLFAGIADRYDLREAWIGTAAAQMRLHTPWEAAGSLSRALARHVPQADCAALARDIVRSTGSPGWCGLSFDGRLSLHQHRPGTLVVTLDDRPVAGRRLPAGWTAAAALSVTIDGQHLLGSPIDIRAIRRVAGLVEAIDGGLSGWAWHPADPARIAEIAISDAAGRRTLRVRADDDSVVVPNLGPLAHPRGFSVPAARLAGLSGPLHIRDPDGRDLYGSPIDPAWLRQAGVAAAAAIGRRYGARTTPPARDAASMPPALPVDLPVPDTPVGADRKRREVDVVVPVHGQRVDSLFATVRAPTRIIVVDDASPDPALRQVLDAMARRRRVRLIRHARNIGFPGAANAGLRAASGRDVVLLNSDTLVPPGWLERLQDAARSAPDIGTVTPISNDASILSYPGNGADNPIPDLAETIRLDRLAHRACGAATVDIPVGVGFCLYIRRDCLDAVGGLRDDIFAQGYGEESDFCLRARHLGWRHVALPGLFVGHCGGRSFGAVGQHLRARNQNLLERLHPGYGALVDRFVCNDPLGPFRRRIDLQRWRAGRTRQGESAILITHNDGGGVERRVAQEAAAHNEAGRRAIVLRPARTADGAPAVELGDGVARDFPNLRFRLPGELGPLLRLLRTERPIVVEAHHLLDHDPAIHDLIAQLGTPHEAHVHDYMWFCPRISLVAGESRYCGEPDLAGCESCIADHGALIEEQIGVQALRDRSARFLRRAARVVAPSRDAADRIARQFPGIRPVVRPHDDDRAIPAGPPAPPRRAGPRRVCVAGAIGVHKGYDTLLACARDAAARRLDLEFVVVGTTIDDARLMATGRVFVTGAYTQDEAVAMIERQHADLGFLPSIWPETWCLALTELWLAGLRVAAFDMGAPAERIRHAGRGFLLPPHLPPGAINNALVDAMASGKAIRQTAPMHAVAASDPFHPVAEGL
jgi:GT2 family glycosyltransferase/glycosyltransferase involved in cell wall biosynthesis